MSVLSYATSFPICDDIPPSVPAGAGRREGSGSIVVEQLTAECNMLREQQARELAGCQADYARRLLKVEAAYQRELRTVREQHRSAEAAQAQHFRAEVAHANTQAQRLVDAAQNAQNMQNMNSAQNAQNAQNTPNALTLELSEKHARTLSALKEVHQAELAQARFETRKELERDHEGQITQSAAFMKQQAGRMRDMAAAEVVGVRERLAAEEAEVARLKAAVRDRDSRIAALLHNAVDPEEARQDERRKVLSASQKAHKAQEQHFRKEVTTRDERVEAATLGLRDSVREAESLKVQIEKLTSSHTAELQRVQAKAAEEAHLMARTVDSLHADVAQLRQEGSVKDARMEATLTALNSAEAMLQELAHNETCREAEAAQQARSNHSLQEQLRLLQNTIDMQVHSTETCENSVVNAQTLVRKVITSVAGMLHVCCFKRVQILTKSLKQKQNHLHRERTSSRTALDKGS